MTLKVALIHFCVKQTCKHVLSSLIETCITVDYPSIDLLTKRK